MVLATLLVLVALTLTAAATARDLFHVWPDQFADAHPLNREIAAVADFLEHRADGRPVVISSRDIEDEDPYVVSVSLDRAIDRRWVDSSQALALPAGAAEAWLIVTADRWVDPLLADVVSLGAGEQGSGGAGGMAGRLYPTVATSGGLKPTAVTQNRLKPVANGAANPLQRVWFDSRGFQPAAAQPATTQPAATQPSTISDMFSLHLLTAANWPVLPTPALSLPPESSFAPGYPLPFCACEPGAAAEPALWLTGVDVGAARPGEELTLLTSWQTGPARFLSLAMFVHLLDGSGNIVAQDDGLGYPPHTWQPGDRFLQLARLPLPPDLPPGDYTLQFGLYDRAGGARWPALNADGQPAGDRVLLMGERIGE